jgi:hypothetical protein
VPCFGDRIEHALKGRQRNREVVGTTTGARGQGLYVVVNECYPRVRSGHS